MHTNINVYDIARLSLKTDIKQQINTKKIKRSSAVVSVQRPSRMISSLKIWYNIESLYFSKAVESL